MYRNEPADQCLLWRVIPANRSDKKTRSFFDKEKLVLAVEVVIRKHMLILPFPQSSDSVKTEHVRALIMQHYAQVSPQYFDYRNETDGFTSP